MYTKTMTARLQVPMTPYKSHVGGQDEAFAAVCNQPRKGTMQNYTKDVIKFIHGASSEDVDLIVQAIKYRRNQLHTQKAQSFRIGDTVSFTGRYGRMETGKVTKVKVKYVVVDTGMSRWNVPGNHLTKVNKSGKREMA